MIDQPSTRKSSSKKVGLFILLLLTTCIVVIICQLWTLRVQKTATSRSSSSHEFDGNKPKRSTAHSLLPSCYPHWKVAISNTKSSVAATNDSNSTSVDHDDDSGGDGGPTTTTTINEITTTTSYSNTHPITRLYYYHVRKAGGSMIRTYLRKVAHHYNIHLQMQEYTHASKTEEVGSRNDTIYITNLRDPVERSISHFKYDGRWDCDQLVRNASLFVPTEANARGLKEWNETHGFEPSLCDVPFELTSCAVQCYIQTFSGGVGCTHDDWFTEYNLALNRLLRYNMIFVYDKFKDARYVTAVEEFFGVRGFNTHNVDMFCGYEAREANERIPLRVNFEHVLKLTYLNEMDNRLYKDVVSSCWADDDEDEKERGGGGEVEYSFPKVDASRFIAQRNRTVIE